MLVSTAAVFLFLVVAYERLTNAELTLREVWPGALIGAVLLQASFQVLPLFVRFSTEVVAVQALGATALLLVWLYVMANAIVFGAEMNWWYGRRDEEVPAWLDRLYEDVPPACRQVTDCYLALSAAAARARWECSRFQAFPSSATVRSSPSGTKIGS